MQEIIKKLEDLNQLVLQGKTLEAFEKYYHDEVVMQENQAAPTIGKQANRKREEEFFSKISDFRGAQVKGLGAGENISFVQWHYDYTHNDWGRAKLHTGFCAALEGREDHSRTIFLRELAFHFIRDLLVD